MKELGPNEFKLIRNLKDLDYTEKLKMWNVHSLIIFGIYNLCFPLITKNLIDNISRF